MKIVVNIAPSQVRGQVINNLRKDIRYWSTTTCEVELEFSDYLLKHATRTLSWIQANKIRRIGTLFRIYSRYAGTSHNRNKYRRYYLKD